MATFGLLHGAWHEPSCWGPVAARLEERGHRTAAPDLPLHDPDAGYEDRIRPALDALADADEPVVVVAHSQSSALGPLVAAARPVSLLVYLCPRMGSVETPDTAPTAFRDGVEFPPPGPDGTTAWDPDVAMRVLYPRVPRERARELAERLRPMAMPPGDYPLPTHPDVPVAVIYAAEDEIFQPDFERFMAREVLGVEPIELPGGHFPMAEDPDGLGDVLLRLLSR
jgi:pimeloyl-ACP methyl ester carboxylesterase